MGRSPKTVGAENGVDRRESGYYSTPAFVAEFIADTVVALNPHGRRALDPCVGKGEMALPLARRDCDVDGFDVLPFDVPGSINFKSVDFLEFYRRQRECRGSKGNLDLPYDFYVANPPYNCHETTYIRDNKSQLRHTFGKIGTHNMYSMFLSAMIDCAKDGAILGILTLDSFLTAKAHADLRRVILSQCTLHYLLLCPTDLFSRQGADVRTCIMILQKGTRHQSSVSVANRPGSTIQFQRQLASQRFKQLPLDEVVLAGSSDHGEFVLEVPTDIRRLFDGPRLGDKFRCVTGISTGADDLHLSKASKPGYSLPFYKNPGARKFFAPPNAYLADNFLELDARTPNFMVRNKDLLFQPGITCSSMGVAFSACRLPPGATYGVNPNIILPDEECWWLMAYLNSRLVTYLVRGVLLRSNMITSGYVARIPTPELDAEAREALGAVSRAAYREGARDDGPERRLEEVNRIVESNLELSGDTTSMLEEFSRDLVRRT